MRDDVAICYSFETVSRIPDSAEGFLIKPNKKGRMPYAPSDTFNFLFLRVLHLGKPFQIDIRENVILNFDFMQKFGFGFR